MGESSSATHCTELHLPEKLFERSSSIVSKKTETKYFTTEQRLQVVNSTRISVDKFHTSQVGPRSLFAKRALGFSVLEAGESH
jgi:hypothetical protein